jgi:hypothetical protein
MPWSTQKIYDAFSTCSDKSFYREPYTNKSITQRLRNVRVPREWQMVNMVSGLSSQLVQGIIVLKNVSKNIWETAQTDLRYRSASPVASLMRGLMHIVCPIPRT